MAANGRHAHFAPGVPPSLLEDSSSRQSFADFIAEGCLWAQVRVFERLPDGRAMPTGARADRSWFYNAFIGYWYCNKYEEVARQLAAERRKLKEDIRAGRVPNTKANSERANTVQTLIPWGAVRPVLLDGDAHRTFDERPVREWLAEYAPPDRAHGFAALLFYFVQEPDDVDLADFERDLAETHDLAQHGRFVSKAVLLFPAEIAAVASPADERHPSDFWASVDEACAAHGTPRIVARFPRAIPREAFLAARPGEYIWQGVAYSGDYLYQVDAEHEELVNQYTEAYAAALRQLIRLEVRPNCEVAVDAACAVVRNNCWPLRARFAPAVFAALDCRTRLHMVLAYLRERDERRRAQIENGLVRLVQSQYLLGWQSEPAVIDFLNFREYDKGRIPREYASKRRSAPAAPARAASKPAAASARGKRSAAAAAAASADPVETLVTRNPCDFRTLQQRYEESAAQNVLPAIDSLVDDAPMALRLLLPALDALGEWVHTEADGYRRLAPEEGAPIGASFVLRPGVPTCWFFVAPEEQLAEIDARYRQKALPLHQALQPGEGCEELPVHSVALAGGLRLVVYSSLVHDSIAALRRAMGSALWQAPWHVFETAARPDAPLVVHLPPLAEPITAEQLRMLAPQPTVNSAFRRARDTLWPRVLFDGQRVDEEGAPRRAYSCSATLLTRAVDASRALYAGRHPMALNNGDALLEPTVFWLAPLRDCVDIKHEGTLPEDVRQHFQRLPHVSIDDLNDEAVVLAYRDWPRVFGETLRLMMRALKRRYTEEHGGDYLRFYAAMRPSETARAELSAALSDRVLAALFPRANHAVPPPVLCKFEELERDAARIKRAAGGDTIAERLAGDSEADDIAADEEDEYRAWLAAQAAAQPPPNGLATRADAVNERVARASNATRGNQSARFIMYRTREWFDAACEQPDEFRDALWERSEDPHKNSIRIVPTPAQGKYAASIKWYDNKTDAQYVAGVTYAVYVYYAVSVWRDLYGGGREKENQALVDAGAAHKRVRAETAKEKLAGYVGGMIAALKERLGGARQPRETFMQFCERLVKPFHDRKYAPASVAGAPAAAATIKQVPTSSKPAVDHSTVEALKRWNMALKLQGPAQRYLRVTRKLDALSEAVLEHSPFLKFIAQEPYVLTLEDGKSTRTELHPALLCFLVGQHGRVESVQRIFLTPDGRKITPPQPKRGTKENKVKLSLGSMKSDNAFFVAQPGRVEDIGLVALAEGPEKALGAACISRYLPSFAAMGVTRLCKFRHLIERTPQPTLLLMGDADHTLPMQLAACDELRKAGWRTVRLWVPHCARDERCRCKDINDVLERHGLLALLQQVAALVPPMYWFTRTLPDGSAHEKDEWRRYDFLAQVNTYSV